MAKNRKKIANQTYRNSDVEIADEMQAEVVQNAKKAKGNSFTNGKTGADVPSGMQVSENLNPDDFE